MTDKTTKGETGRNILWADGGWSVKFSRWIVVTDEYVSKAMMSEERRGELSKCRNELGTVRYT